jgi:hypothetical protein
MTKKIIIAVAILLTAQFSFAVEATQTTNTTPTQIESTVQQTSNKERSKKTKEVTKNVTSEKKKKKSFFAYFDIIGKIKEFVSGKSKQNENAINDAANGTYQPRAKRALSSDPKARAIQENLDKLQAERLKKYETD